MEVYFGCQILLSSFNFLAKLFYNLLNFMSYYYLFRKMNGKVVWIEKERNNLNYLITY